MGIVQAPQTDEWRQRRAPILALFALLFSAIPTIAILTTAVYATAQTPPTTTTIAPLGDLPVTPSTLPLITKPQSSHVSPVFAILSIAGFVVVLLLVVVQVFLTRASRRRRGARTL